MVLVCHRFLLSSNVLCINETAKYVVAIAETFFQTNIFMVYFSFIVHKNKQFVCQFFFYIYSDALLNIFLNFLGYAVTICCSLPLCLLAKICHTHYHPQYSYHWNSFNNKKLIHLHISSNPDLSKIVAISLVVDEFHERSHDYQDKIAIIKWIASDSYET